MPCGTTTTTCPPVDCTTSILASMICFTDFFFLFFYNWVCRVFVIEVMVVDDLKTLPVQQENNNVGVVGCVFIMTLREGWCVISRQDISREFRQSFSACCCCVLKMQGHWFRWGAMFVLEADMCTLRLAASFLSISNDVEEQIVDLKVECLNLDKGAASVISVPKQAPMRTRMKVEWAINIFQVDSTWLAGGAPSCSRPYVTLVYIYIWCR